MTWQLSNPNIEQEITNYFKAMKHDGFLMKDWDGDYKEVHLTNLPETEEFVKKAKERGSTQITFE